MKRVYQKPALRAVKIQQTHIICTSLNNVTGNAGLNYGGSGSGPARARSNSGWDGWDDEE